MLLLVLFQAFALSRANDPVDLNFLQSIPTILGNLHDYFIHVAAKIDKQHEQVGQGPLGELGSDFWRVPVGLD